jgi:hypothetical protein
LTTNKRYVLLLSILAVLFGSVWQAEALSINILNPSFENPQFPDGGYTLPGTVNPIPDWNVVGRAGVFNPTTSSFTNVPDGFQTAFINNGTIGQ